MSLGLFMLASAGCVLAWTAAFRLPFRASSRRHRIGMWLSDRLGLRAEVSFAIFGTVLYMALGTVAFIVLTLYARIPVRSFTGSMSAVTVLATAMGIAGASSLNAFCMSIVYRLEPNANVPGEIAGIQWIASILALPRSSRWLAPALGALVEELVFRGAIFLGMGVFGASLALAAAFSTLLFVVGQVLLVSTRMQGVVMCVSSCTLGIVGTLLVAVTGGILPAMIVHMSYAGFYTNMSIAGAEFGARRRLSL